MKLLIFIFNKTEKLDDLLTEFVKKDIKGATIIESAGMARLLSKKHDEDEIPFLGSLRSFLNPEREKNNMVLAVIKDNQLNDAVQAIETIVGDLTKRDAGVVFSIPIDFSKGISNIE